MTSTELNRVLPSPNETTGKRRYMEQYGYAVVTNRYLRIAVLCLTVIAIGLLILNLKTLSSYRNFKPLVIRINEVGRAEAVAYESMTYQPRDAEIKYFLIQFVTKYYGRMRATVRENYARSLYFLDGRLAHRLALNPTSFALQGQPDVSPGHSAATPQVAIAPRAPSPERATHRQGSAAPSGQGFQGVWGLW